MADATADAPVEAPPESPQPEPAPETAAPAASSIEDLLAEYERDTARPAPATPVDEALPAAPEMRPPAEADQVPGNDVLKALSEWALGLEHERVVARENADVATAISRAEEALRDYPVLPAGYAERFLRSAYQMDAELQEAWDARYASPEAAARCERAVQRTMRSLVESARRMPDRDATEDRMLVASAVRGASNSAPPPAPPPNYNRLSNQEFADKVERDFGYRPL